MYEVGQQVTVVDGGWAGTIERIDEEGQWAYIRFPGRPDLPAYAFEALTLTPGMFDMLTDTERGVLFYKLSDWAHNLYEVGHVLARAALAHRDTDSIAWDYRQEYVDARSEICELIAELEV